MLDTVKELNFRLAVMSESVRKSSIPLGRTGVMKIAYFLQQLRDVPLGYSFRIYTYGPYDSQVLEDLRIAESIKAVETTTVRYARTTGVQITAGSRSEKTVKAAGSSIDSYSSDIDWVLETFSSKTASDLEIDSTIIFVDRAQGCRECVDLEAIVSAVHSIKPHHSAEKITKEALALSTLGLLASVNASPNTPSTSG